MEKKIDRKTGVIIRYDDKGNPFVSMPVSSVPYKIWQEWEKDCKLNFSGNRWAKMYHDHLKVREFDLVTEVEMLKEEIEQAKTVEEEDDNPLGLLGGGDEQERSNPKKES